MKRIIAIILTVLMMCFAAGCSSQGGGDASSREIPETQAQETVAQEIQAPVQAETLSAEKEASIADTVDYYEFEGVIYAGKNGAPLYSFANGTQENGQAIALDTPLPVGSVSKQFCAAAVLLLQEQGKLSVNDTLDKFYPEYAEGNKLTIHDLLSMRSGIPEITESSGVEVTDDKTEEENIAAIKAWVFSQPLSFEPDSMFTYVNVNYMLLSDIVSQVSGKKYSDFIRESFFAPLGMNSTGTIGESKDAPGWAKGGVYRHVDTQPGLTNGCGDIITNAADLTLWLNALSSGRVISEDSYKLMTSDYSPEGEHYGYGLYVEFEGGIGHPGNIGDYSSVDYINTEEGLTLVFISNTIAPASTVGLAGDLLSDMLD